MIAPASTTTSTALPTTGAPASTVPPRPDFRRRSKPRTGRVVLGLAVVAALGTGGAMTLVPKSVTTTPVVRGTAIDAVYATGTVEANDRVVVKSKAAGTIDLKVREGATVKKGDLLARIDSPSLKYDLARGKAEAWAASQQASVGAPQLASLDAHARAIEAELRSARDERDRARTLVRTGAVVQADLDRDEARVSALEAQLQANQAERRSLRIELSARASGSSAIVDSLAARLSDTEIRAPMDGVVLSRAVEPGETVMINQPLLRIGDTAHLVLECAIDESDIGKVKVGQTAAVSIYAFRGSVFHGEVVEILPDADRVKKAFISKIALTDAPEGLRSGMTVEVNVLAAERAGSLLAPAEGIDTDGTVLVVESGKLARRTPTLGVRDLSRVEVTEGLAEGDLVVVGGAANLSPGARVRPVQIPPADAPKKGGVRAGMSL